MSAITSGVFDTAPLPRETPRDQQRAAPEVTRRVSKIVGAVIGVVGVGVAVLGPVVVILASDSSPDQSVAQAIAFFAGVAIGLVGAGIYLGTCASICDCTAHQRNYEPLHIAG